MPYIFRFHKGTNNNIYDWKASDRIASGHLEDINEKTNILSSSAGTSIPTPLARLFLFKTAFEIMATQVARNSVEVDSIYAGFVSETLDLLELLYKCGSDTARFRYQRWLFSSSDEAIAHFGNQPGHKLLATSFRQAASQHPFNRNINITLIYYRESGKEVLIGGTSPFTFVFTSPNFKRKMRERGFRQVKGMVSDDLLFDSRYTQLHERDGSFVKYIESLVNMPDIGDSFKGISAYVANTRQRYEAKFNGVSPGLVDIKFGDTTLMVSGISLQQVSEADFKAGINHHSDFRIDLPHDTNYRGEFRPLFLLHKMAQSGQYTSPTNAWSSATEISELEYPENSIEGITIDRELPGLPGIKYPFFSSFDFFEPDLIKLPGYFLNDERFITLKNNQSFIYPIKPLFFHLFPIHRIREFVTIEETNNEIKFTITVPVSGPGKGPRKILCSRTYHLQHAVNYEGILGIFPFTRASDEALLFTNQYTVASYEKTNTGCALKSLKYFKNDGVGLLQAKAVVRSNYRDINTKTTYYQISRSFDIIQLCFRKNNIGISGLILPRFQEVRNGDAEYIYAIDFGTSNTHVEYGLVVDKRVIKAQPFEIGEKKMQMIMLNKPNRVEPNDGESYMDYERSTGNKIDRARKVTLREFVPFQIGVQQSASVRFPFRTATCESDSFTTNAGNTRLFIDANIGFNIDEDQITDNVNYKTDLKWLLQKSSVDPYNITRVSLFAKELMLLIRTKVLLEDAPGSLKKLKIILAFPISMGDMLKRRLLEIFETQRAEVFGAATPKLVEPVTESIAPYYELKSTNVNIQNDNFCNIDIGGGTTDILMTQTEGLSGTNQLRCFCSSFRFAGRQLWSSGAAEHTSSDNGFVAYYKEFMPNVQVDIERSGDLQRMLAGNSIKTEDIVGLLFGNPNYRFKDIFAEKPAFRVVPLIHYAAILFYTCRLAEWKNIALPRTVSFSGKGSEYLNLLFPAGPNENGDLKGFTQKVLGIFSNKVTRSDFIVAKSSEPKVITARGAVYYAAEEIWDNSVDEWGNTPDSQPNPNNKVLVKENVLYKGFKTFTYEDKPITYAELISDETLYRDIMSNVIEFLNQLFDNAELVAIINKKLEINNFYQYKSFFIPSGNDVYDNGVLRDSFKSTLSGLNPGDNVDDSPFFFALNYSLIELSKTIAKTT